MLNRGFTFGYQIFQVLRRVVGTATMCSVLVYASILGSEAGVGLLSWLTLLLGREHTSLLWR